ncbi:ferritin-like domain-containing protein [Halpernia frigidisoli]|uniref:Ferritin-like domain-containing protein n=1 Tax=Halpernia frigidisoli TaxID=1125876 RepID=A0A1I3FWK7_9FLAO|nr:ferritin-like domain-containing protein [Halpernia frigidisoli]SFI15462.1 Ferritin-like domain-containing protein [Halpernia frigidisoli]
MNLLKILDQLSDDKLFEADGITRKAGFSQLANFGKKAVVAGIPLGLSSFMSNSAKAEVKKSEATFAASAALDAVSDALNLALTLEYLEDEFYRIGLGAAGLVPAADRVVIQQISKHETAHVAYLKAALGTAAVSKPTFDFTGGKGGTNGPFKDVFTNYATFLALAQTFEDTGVRAYKGQAGNVASNKAVLQVALQIHSVEARHASQVRRMRGLKGWIIGNDGGGPVPQYTAPSYNGEENLIQAGFNTSTKFGVDAGSASFDETITGQLATTIASTFIV